MKKVVFASLFLIISIFSYAQTDETSSEKKVKLGFNIGANYSNLTTKNFLPLNVDFTGGMAIRLGIISEIKVNKTFSISPKAELTFNKNQVTIMNGDGSITAFKEMPTSMDFMTHFMLIDRNKKLSPYFFVGPNLKIPVEYNPVASILPSTKTNFALDFGIGFDRAFSFFHIAPELRYSFGLINLSRSSSIPNMQHHNISLVINFLG